MQELTADAFVRLDQPPPLGEDDIHLCRLALAETATPRDVATAARAMLDRLLRHYTGSAVAPEILRGPHGKPHAPSAGGIEFNLSHSGPYVLLAFARGQALGVDVERRRRRLSLLALARRFFAAEEAEALAALPEPDRPACFLQLWTRKEAVLKALGEGLNFGLHRLTFAIDATGSAGALQRIAQEAGPVADWQVRALAPAAGLVGALAWRGAERGVCAFELAA